MDLESKKFGGGPRELCGAVDLINQFKVWPHHELFCKRSLPLSISETHYLQNVVGDREIRKGEGMELDQLFHNISSLRERNAHIHAFDICVLREAFQMRETTSVVLPISQAEKGIPTAAMKSSVEPARNKERQQKNENKDKKHKEHKHRNKDGGNEKHRKRSGIDPGPENLKKQPDKRALHYG